MPSMMPCSYEKPIFVAMKGKLRTISLLLFLVLLEVSMVTAQSRQRLIKQAYSQYEEGNYATTVKLLDEAEQKGSRKAYLYYLRGNCKDILRNHEAAITDFKLALQRKKKYPEAYAELGLSYFSLERNKDAIQAFDKAIAQRNDFALAYLNRGSVKCAAGDAAGARADWEKAKQLGFEHPLESCD